MSSIIKFVGKQTILVVLIGLVLVFSLLSGATFLSGQNLQNVARQISFDGLVGFGQAICLLAGGIDLSVGSVLSMSAALTMGLQPMGVGVAVLAALLFGVLIGAVNGLLVTRFRIVPFIATLGTMTLVRGLMLTYTRQQPIAGTVESFTFWGSGSIGFIPVPIVITLAVMLLLHLFLQYTRFGRSLYAVGGESRSGPPGRHPHRPAPVRGFRHQRHVLGASGRTAGLAAQLVDHPRRPRHAAALDRGRHHGRR